MIKEQKILEILETLSKKYIDGRVIYWEFEAVARRKLGISHSEFWGLVEKLVDEGKIEAELSKNRIDMYFKPTLEGCDEG